MSGLGGVGRLLVVGIRGLARFNYRFGPARGDALLEALYREMHLLDGALTVHRWDSKVFVVVMSAECCDEAPMMIRKVLRCADHAYDRALAGADVDVPWWIVKDRAEGRDGPDPRHGVFIGSAAGALSEQLLAKALDDYERQRGYGAGS